MQRKIQLNEKDKYAINVAAKYLAKMVAGFIDGSTQALRIGCEQGALPEWDDVVIEHHDNSYEHIQIKRQDTAFDDKYPVERGVFAKGRNKGEPQSLSVLDKALAKLASPFDPQIDTTDVLDRRFSLIIPGVQIEVKKGLQIRHLASLCSHCSKDGSTGSGLAERARSDNVTRNLFTWLTTWCGFQTWDHILTALSRLDIIAIGHEVNLCSEIDEILMPYFITPNEVRDKIIHYISDNASDIAAITPIVLLNHLRSYLRPDKSTWTQYCHDPIEPSWSVAGIHSESTTAIEPSADIVSALWALPGSNRILKVVADCPNQLNHRSLPAALIRLALHLSHPGQALFTSIDTWRRETYQAVAGTLGLEEDCLQNLPWTDNSAPLNLSDVRKITSISGDRGEADNLVAAMDATTWDRVCVGLNTKINLDIEDSDLLVAIEHLWTKWKAELCLDTAQRNKFLEKMLHPDAEGEEILGSLRMGLQTVKILTDGLFLLLVVTIGLGDEDASWGHLGGAGAIRTIGLRSWGGPAGQPRRPRDIDEDGEVLLGKEIADVVLLSGVKSSPGEIKQPTLAESISDNDNFGKPRIPMLVTNSLSLRSMLRGATLVSLRAYFASELQSKIGTREENINHCSGRGNYVN